MPAEAVPVGWDVAEDEAFHRIVRTGTALARPELAHSVHVEVEGLGSHRRHWYRFVAEGLPSATGTVRTAPAAGAALDRYIGRATGRARLGQIVVVPVVPV